MSQIINEGGTFDDPNQELSIEYDYVYLAHPRAVTGFSWRQISKFMPK